MNKKKQPNPRFTDAGQIYVHLPYLKNPLRGRDEDVHHITEHLGKSVIQITATGGIGKSRLCAEIALNYPQGAIWFRCESYKSYADLQIALRQHADLPEGTSLDVIKQQIISQKPLIVMDNAETVTDDKRPDFVRLLTELSQTGVPILLTSRMAWKELKPRIEHELTFLDSINAEAITRDFANAEKITLTDTQITEFARACRYYPRLIEFALAQLHEFEYATILKRLNNLPNSPHLDMQNILDEMITRTVAQMAKEPYGADADALLRRLTWLTATFPKTVIIALKPDDMDEETLDDVLALLRRYQFIRYNTVTGRYTIAELVREALGVDMTAFNAYADFYIRRAREIFYELDNKPELWGDQEGGKNFDDIKNINALGLALLLQTQNGTKGDLERVLKFARMTRRYVTDRMELRLWNWLEMGLSATQLLYEDNFNDATLIDNLALMLAELSVVYQSLGWFDKALNYKEKALLLYQKLQDKWSEATLLNNIGMAYIAQKDYQKALIYYESALLIVREIGNKSGEAMTLSNIGALYRDLEDYLKALEYYKLALPITRSVRDKNGEATILNNMGAVYFSLGYKTDALYCYNESLSICDVVGNKTMKANSYFNIGILYDILGDRYEAIKYYEYAITTTFPDDPHLPQWRSGLARLKKQQGDDTI